MKRLAITAGDPTGIGPEIIGKAFSLAPEIMDQIMWTVIGPSSWLSTLPKHPHVTLLDPCESIIESGAQSYAYVEKAIQLALAHHVEGIVTAPICKEAWVRVNKPFLGHTEMLASLSKTTRYAMAFSSPSLNIMLATIHIPLVDVSSQLSTENLVEKIRLAHEFGLSLGYPRPRIGVAGLNPHAGESGHMGQEEIQIIEPAIYKSQKDGILVTGPFPADTLFYRAVNEHHVDIVLAMYHDQALAPLKLIAFHEAVNVTIGLPFIRTSPDHGTAFDLAGKDIANPSSMIAAMRLAVRMANK